MSINQNNTYNKIYHATTNGYAEVFTNNGQKITASSSISYMEALSLAKQIAFSTALSQAKIEADKINYSLINKNIIKNESNEKKIEILEEKIETINKNSQYEIEPINFSTKNTTNQEEIKNKFDKEKQYEIKPIKNKKEESNLEEENISENENIQEENNEEENISENENNEEENISENENIEEENIDKYYSEINVCYTGESSIENNEYIEIVLPNAEENIATVFTVHITPLCKQFYYVNKVENNKFKVFRENSSFNWVVFGKLLC